MTPRLTVAALSQLSQADFTAALDGIFEHSPWVAEAAWRQAPFSDADQLLTALLDAMWQAPEAAQRQLILAHPELAGKAALAGELTQASTAEQAGAGLAACSPEEYARIQNLNSAFQTRFGMPFIIAVRGLTRGDIIAAMEARLALTAPEAFAENLHQIGRIAALRLHDRLG
ncbi:2-oxo-4-hydroxy-4-carboxy-5-ureidoimidazoline decarboxylase [Chitinimonas sp.]|uniref:2-oxo-4-hydroxy-4-carboxy-5-ureidoimidazoline decarboxylase n=1 Tax=Chitinimonas sp. TaxID=1934313 RepID=UPI002F9223BB